MNETQEKEKVRCENCRKTVEYGRDVITASRGVIGPRGVIPLDQEHHFCSEECVSSYFNGDSKDIPRLPPRIP